MVYIHRPRDASSADASHSSSRLQRTYADAYSSILRAARLRKASSPSSSASAVLILVSPDVDALCALKLLVGLFRADGVPHKVIPVDGYRLLRKTIDESVTGNNEVHTIILLNLGSVLSLPSYLGLPPGCTAHVLDSHRPWNLDNVFASGSDAERIVIWDDGDIEKRLQDERAAYEAIEFEPESDSEASDYSDSESEANSEEDQSNATSEDEAEEEGEGRPRQRRRVSGSDEEGDEEEAEPYTRRKRRRRKLKRISRSERRAHRMRIARYYQLGTSYGLSVAVQVNLLAESLGRGDNEGLWLAILGHTSQYLANQIDRDVYEDYVLHFRGAVAAYNPPRPVSSRSSPYASDSSSTSDAASARPLDPDDTSIRPTEEMRFTLYRHWNLYESMYHSAYVAGKLGIWQEKGRKKLRGLLAKMGFSLQQCQQYYSHMDMDLKRSLSDQISRIAPEYGLVELTYPSFLRSYGFRSELLSAGDVVEGLGALLEAAYGLRIDVDAPGGSVDGANAGTEAWKDDMGAFGGGKLWSVGDEWMYEEALAEEDKENAAPGAVAVTAAAAAAADGRKAKKKREEAWVRSFWKAFDALGSDVTLLRRSLALSRAVHRAVIRQGASLIDKQAIRSLRRFRLAVIKEGPDLPIFAHPATLGRLALWLVDALRDIVASQEERARAQKAEKEGAEESIDTESRRRRTQLPFVVASLDEQRDAFLVVGVTGAPDYGDVRKNLFGLAFQEAAERSGARTRHDRFETSVVEVRRDDLQTFVENLHLRMA